MRRGAVHAALFAALLLAGPAAASEAGESGTPELDVGGIGAVEYQELIGPLATGEVEPLANHRNRLEVGAD